MSARIQRLGRILKTELACLANMGRLESQLPIIFEVLLLLKLVNLANLPRYPIRDIGRHLRSLWLVLASHKALFPVKKKGSSLLLQLRMDSTEKLR